METRLSISWPKTGSPRPRTIVLKPEELERLIAQAQPWLRCAIILAAYAGLRRADVLAACPANYDHEKRVLAVIQQKTKRQVSIPTNEMVHTLLLSTPKADAATPFVSAWAGKPVGPEMLKPAWQALKKAAGIPQEVHFHDLRRTVAHAIYDLSHDLRAVEAFLGHHSLSSTIVYLEGHDPEKLRPLVNQLWKPRSELKQ